MANPSEADLAEILARNLAVKLKPEYRLSAPRQQRQMEMATSPRPKGIARPEPQQVPKAKPFGSQSNQRKLALAMSEDDLQKSVIDLAHLYGWKVAHFRSARVTRKDGTTYWQTPVAADGEGFPDLIMIRKNRILAVELKRERGKAESAQIEWLHLFMLTRRVEAYLWKPSSWLDGTIEGLLR